MGKRYYCDYCDKTMVASPSIIRTHNKGILHQKLVNEHYQQHKDPETILKEESVKKPCTRFLQGECQFGAICRYSHYTPEQLQELQAYVSMKNVPEIEEPPSFQDLYRQMEINKNSEREKDTIIVFDRNGVILALPWSYNPVFDKLENLPPSIKRFESSDFEKLCVVDWGLKKENVM